MASSSSLRGRRPRIGCVVGALVLAPLASCAVSLATTMFVGVAPIDDALARAAFARESAAAAAVGLAPEGEGASVELDRCALPAFDVPAAAGECVAVVAAASGTCVVTAATIEGADGEILARAPNAGAVASHVAWCAERDANLRARVELSSRSSAWQSDAATAYHRVHRGRPPALFDALERVVPTAAGARSVSTAFMLRHADRLAAGRAPLGPAIEIADYRARLVPEQPATYAELHRLADNRRGTPITPRWDPLGADAPPAWRPFAPPGGVSPLATLGVGLSLAPSRDHPAVGYVNGAARRTLAVIHPPALGARCVDVQLVRLAFGYAARVDTSSGAALATDRHVSHGAVCAAGPVALFAREDDRERYLLRIFAAR
ncbi:MAG: hypothetical protein KF729_01925 [Sandaracinaceae bacterium]|nr:hypothetical protein [Sandaracinaceae bacterium]